MRPIPEAHQFSKNWRAIPIPGHSINRDPAIIMPIHHPPHSRPVAAVDLGSNSFHMIVAELRNNEIVVVDRLREMVRLGSGLTDDRELTPEIQRRALECLERFGQRLRPLPRGDVRIVGTNTLRAARNAGPMLLKAEAALGHPIDIISGIEEARLIYQGVSQNLPADGKRRLVMDIGGGSTEYIIGIDRTPVEKESLHMGCVSMSMAHFPDGKISQKRFRKAVLAAHQKLEPFQRMFHRRHWDEAIGASGTLRAIGKILSGRGWTHNGIDQAGLDQLVDALLRAGRLDSTSFPDLNPERYPSFAGGLAIIHASFKALDIQHMRISNGALREGLLQDLLGRINHEDIRDRTVATLVTRYHTATEHAERIRVTLHGLTAQLTLPRSVEPELAQQWLDWATALHEIGRDIAHSGYHKHGGYILENADLPGFSTQDQLLLASLVRCHRKKFTCKPFKELAPPWNEAGPTLAILLRLAIVLHRNRDRQLPPLPELKLHQGHISLQFPDGWLENHSLTAADLEQEAAYLAAAGLELTFR